jgi:acetolactate synthase-1/2/3 large subunit|tara:strand:- start:1312 stop:3141 length:1830 start_codon:yes stop_codon:yes gene_type:complete
MKVADYIINYLADYGIEDVFLVYGAANGDLVDAFTRNDKIRYIATMHEQGGGFAAEGHAKISGKIGVAMATSGPGGMNFVTSIGNCFYDSVPCLFITGQIKSQFMRPDKSIRQIGFQETDIVSVVEPMVKYAKTITDPLDVKYQLEKALHLATEGRPGPVLLDIPLDIQQQNVDEKDLLGYDVSLKNTYDLDVINNQIDTYIDDLKNSKRPCLMIGGGVRLSGAVDELLELGRQLKIPMFPTWNALDIVCSDYEYYGGRIGTYGGAGRNFGIQNSDLLLAIGSRISGRITGGNVNTFAREAKKYMVDVDKPGLQKKLQQVPFDECIYSDAKLFINLLIERLKNEDLPSFDGWVDKVMDWKIKYDPVVDNMFKSRKYPHPYAFIRILSEEMKSNDIFVADCGGNIVVSNHAFETKTGQRYFTNNGNSPMGFSFAGAIGASIAADDLQDVVCVIGDGGFNMNIQELQTIVNYNIPVKTIILNNHIYGITKAFQETNFDGRAEACGPIGYNPPNFKDIVEAYKIPTMVVDDGMDYDKVRAQIKEFLNHKGPIVMDFNCHEYHTYDPKIVGWKTPIEDMYPYLSEDEFNENMYIEPIGQERVYPKLIENKLWD